MHLAYIVGSYSINSKVTFFNFLRSLPRNSPGGIISNSCVFDKFILTVELNLKSLGGIETFSSLNNNLRGKSVSLVPIIFDDNFKVTALAFLLLISIESLITLRL